MVKGPFLPQNSRWPRREVTNIRVSCNSTGHLAAGGRHRDGIRAPFVGDLRARTVLERNHHGYRKNPCWHYWSKYAQWLGARCPHRWVPRAVPKGLPFNVAQQFMRMAEGIREGKASEPRLRCSCQTPPVTRRDSEGVRHRGPSDSLVMIVN